jgi:hypothetical protein
LRMAFNVSMMSPWSYFPSPVSFDSIERFQSKINTDKPRHHSPAIAISQPPPFASPHRHRIRI